MKKFLTPTIALIVLLVLTVFITRECGRKIETVTVNTVTIDTVDHVLLKTITNTKTLVKPVPYSVIQVEYKDVDTAAILADYNKVKAYVRILYSDSNADITAYDTVFQNSLGRARVEAKFFVHDTVRTITKIVTTMPPAPRNKVYVGFQSGALIPDKILFMPEILFNTKRDHLYSLAYDPFNKVASFGIYWKIKIKQP